MRNNRRFKVGALAAMITSLLGFGLAHAQTNIPLQLVTVPVSPGNSYQRLVIDVGVAGGPAEPYLFDTGSSLFNVPAAYVGSTNTVLANGASYTYSDGNGFYGNLATVPSVSFYAPGNTTPAATITATGAGYVVNEVTAHLLGDNPGGAQQIDIYNPDTKTTSIFWAQPGYPGPSNAPLLPPGTVTIGTFGAGDFASTVDNGTAPGTDNYTKVATGSILGQSTTSGYVVAANAQPGQNVTNCAPCVMLGLTPALTAQFSSIVPWNPVTGIKPNGFPTSGANSSTEFGLTFNYIVTYQGNALSYIGTTLLDTGTNFLNFHTNADFLAFETEDPGYLNVGATVTMTGGAPASQAAIFTAQDPNTALTTYQIALEQNNQAFDPDQTAGIGFFLQDSVLYNLAGEATGYTSNFVTDQNITTPFDVTAADGPLGLAGIISGSGGVMVDEGASATLTGTNSYTGSTDIHPGGSLVVTGPGSISSSSGITDNGIFDVSGVTPLAPTITSLGGDGVVQLGSNALVLTQAAGNFSGSLQDGGFYGGSGGGLIIAGGSETLSGNNAYTGGTAVASGATLSVTGSIQNLLVNDGLVENTGTINGAVLNAGTLANNGRIAGSVLDSGLLTGNGTIGGALIVNGKVSPGNPGNSNGTITVNGNTAFAPGSTYIAQLGATGSSDLIVSNGSASINDGIISLLPTQGFSPRIGAAYTVLTAPGITGNFTPDDIYFGTATSLLPFLGTDIVNNGSQVNVTLVRSPVPFAALAQTQNQHDAASAADTLSANAKLTATLIALPGAQAPAAFTALSGEAYSSIQSTLQAESFYVRDAIDSRLRQTTDAALAGATAPQTALLGSRLTLWEQSYGSWGNLSGNSDTASMTSSAGGFIMGLDGTLAGWRTGAAGGVSQSSFSANAVTSSGSSNNYDLAVYTGRSFAGYGPGSLSLHFGGAYSWHDLSARRGVRLPDLQQSFSTNYAAHTTQFFGETAYGLTFRTAIRLEPFAGLAYTRLGTDGFSEGPGSAALTAQGNTLNTYESTLGARAALPFTLGKLPFAISGTLGWQHGFGDLNPATTMRFVAGSQSFAAFGVPLAANAMLLNAGITGRLGHADLTLAYTGQIAPAAKQNELNATIGWKF